MQYRASGPSPFTLNCDGGTTGTVFQNAEVEPHVAVDPSNPNNLIGVWQQDRWSNGSSRGLMSAASSDGGQTWTRTPLPVSRCGGGTFANGGDYARATDPWVTFAPDGTAYAMGLVTTGASFEAGSVNAMLVVRSTDRGRSWSAPTTLIRDGAGFFNDKNTITADPFAAAFVYATWDRLVAGDAGGPSYFSRTINGGVTWEAARAIYDPGPASQTLGNVIVVAPNGTLVNLFTQIDRVSATSTVSHLDVIRSFDRGVTWTGPTRIADLLAVGTRDPQSNVPVRDGASLAQIAVGASGHLFVVWQDARFNNGNFDSIAISRSTDNGATWSAPSRVSAAGAAAFTPSVHVRANGDVGVTYYDLRNNTAAASLLADYWLARSSDGGVTWTETRVATSFDVTTAPQAGGAYFLGDYQALVSRNNVFVPFFVKTTGDLSNRTDVYAAPAVSVAAAAQQTALQQVLAQLTRKPEIASRAIPSDFRITDGLRRNTSAQAERSMRWRVPQWGEKTMRADVAPP
ncbi:exo-alpha-sialidase [Lysobacter terrestris]|uniref:exo-alpha-sialidase n=2 Tax=Agrilutibacter terrestris TaxID=2865112 RepID=A0A7H0G1E1_9GAMM|nr:exo-alpha-sialidase [Lysobacter terrestris]